jgi:hypothetical protein
MSVLISAEVKAAHTAAWKGASVLPPCQIRWLTTEPPPELSPCSNKPGQRTLIDFQACQTYGDGDLVRISAEFSDMPLQPFKGGTLIL